MNWIWGLLAAIIGLIVKEFIKIMALIIEDGSVVPNANSFVTVADARIAASEYGLALPADEADAEAALITGGMWIKQQESELQGARIDAAQTLSYPRTPVYLYTFLQASNFIPQELIDSQVIAAVEQGGITGSILTPLARENIKKENLQGTGDIEYFSGGSASSISANMSTAFTVLQPLTKSALSSSGGGLCLQRGC